MDVTHCPQLLYKAPLMSLNLSVKTTVTKLGLALGMSLLLAGCLQSSEERAAEHLENGLALVAEGDLPRALVEFRNTVALDDTNLEAHRQMAQANLKLDRYQAAYTSYLRLVEASPNDMDGRLALSELAFLARNWGEFERHGGRVVDLSPDAPEAVAVRLGLEYRAALKAKDANQGQTILAEAEALAGTLPENPIVRRIRIDAYMADGNYTDALALIDASIAAAPKDLSLYTIKLQLLARLDDEAGLEAELVNMLDVFPEDRQPKETYLRFLMSRDRVDDAEAFLNRLFVEASPEERNDAFISLIQFIRQTKGAERALARIDAALAEEEDASSVWQVLRGSLIFDLGRREDGIAAIEAVLDTAEPLPPQEMLDAKIVLGQMLLTDGNEVGARKQIEEVLTDDPKNARALKMRAGWLINDDETSAAINDLRLALDQDPEDADIMVLMAQAYERAGNRSLMQSFLASAVETSNNAPRYTLLLADSLVADDRFVDAESTLIASLRIAPGNVDVLSALGGVYLQLNDMPRADQVAKTLAAIDTPEAQSSADNLQAEVIVRQLGVDQALDFLEEQATDAEKGDAFAKLVLIQARLRAGKTGDALSFAKTAVAEEPEDLRLRNALALSYAASQDFAAAEREFETILQARPDAVSIYLQLARLRGAQDQPEAARQTIDDGLAQVPDAADLLWAKASYLQQSGDVDGAIDIYEGLYARNSGSLVVANNLASLLTTYRDDEDSLARAEVIARRLEGTDVPAFQDTYGWLLFRRGEVQAALPYLEDASAGLPQDPIVQLHLGETYAALGRRADALAQFNKALDVAGPLANDALRSRIQTRITEVSAASDN